MEKCVVLLSGGLDSATALAVAKKQGFDPCALTIIYGQRHEIEIQAAKRVASAFEVKDHRFVNVDLGQIGGSALTDDIEVPKDSLSSDIPVTYVPARNTVFLSIALGLAEVIGGRDIFMGVNAIDYSGYPDCRPEFIEAFARLANLATKAGVEGLQFKVHTPLMALRKSEIIKLGQGLGVDYGLTHSCYDPSPSGRACGHCDSCLIRKAAFEELDQQDPVLTYV